MAAAEARDWVCAAQLRTAGYLFETPDRPMLSTYWDLIAADELIEAMDYARNSGLDQLDLDMGPDRCSEHPRKALPIGVQYEHSQA